MIVPVSSNFPSQLLNWLRSDGRHFQMAAQMLFLITGILSLGWDALYLSYACAFFGALATQFVFVHKRIAPVHSLKSALITALGLCLLLRANSPFIFLFAAMLAIGQKFAIRVNGKHLWNPANFGIVLCVLLSGEAWISPGQWGTAPLLVCIIGTAGLGVLAKVQRLETALVYVATMFLLEVLRNIVFLGWDWDVVWHKMSMGSLWLYAFFMITDPMSTPSNRWPRVIWTVMVASITFYIANFYFIPTAAMWVLFVATPLSPWVDKLFGNKTFQWQSSASPRTIS
jgi:Na+-transporting NADH:ubiquinone oxidoreductase subunit NqrB